MNIEADVDAISTSFSPISPPTISPFSLLPEPAFAQSSQQQKEFRLVSQCPTSPDNLRA